MLVPSFRPASTTTGRWRLGDFERSNKINHISVVVRSRISILLIKSICWNLHSPWQLGHDLTSSIQADTISINEFLDFSTLPNCNCNGLDSRICSRYQSTDNRGVKEQGTADRSKRKARRLRRSESESVQTFARVPPNPKHSQFNHRQWRVKCHSTQDPDFSLAVAAENVRMEG
jgi:hypothetical protein